jgi:hypothetical protein
MGYKEIFKLKGMLEEANIPFTFDDKTFIYHYNGQEGYQIRLNDNIDVVEHFGSYGEKQDLLEIMGALTVEELQNDEVLGWLTADEVFKRFKYCYEHNTNIYREE